MNEKNTLSEKNLSVSEKVRIRFNETDPLGIVWHGNYIVYFEDGREAFLAESSASPIWMYKTMDL